MFHSELAGFPFGFDSVHKDRCHVSHIQQNHHYDQQELQQEPADKEKVRVRKDEKEGVHDCVVESSIAALSVIHVRTFYLIVTNGESREEKN